MDCALSTISNRTNGFDFAELFHVYLYLNQTCSWESDIFFPRTKMLTEAVCRKITQTGTSIWSGWTPYPISEYVALEHRIWMPFFEDIVIRRQEFGVPCWLHATTFSIWTRIVTWKLPLFQLVAQLPRPPLGAGVETAVLVHLLGDPIDSMVSMLLTLSMCDTRAKQAKKICLASGVRPSHSEYHRTWKSLAIMMVSYDECGLPWKADGICKE